MLIEQILSEASKKSKSDLIPYLLKASSEASKKGIEFNQEELTLLLSSLKEGKSMKEQQKIDALVRVALKLSKKYS